ncbi:MAG: hypothetical protein IJV34_03785 [Prevotella sp.]|nr:hypothetical protein [Prevotella sp.]
MAREERVRFRYGICLNDGCSKCKSKEVQEIPARKDFVCAECGKPLRECPPPKKGPNMKVIGGAIAAVVVLGGGAAALFMGGGDEQLAGEVKAPVEVVDTQKVDTPAVAAPVETAPVAEPKKEEPKQAEPAQPKQPVAKNPSWGKYDGARDANGLPHGNGVLRITRSTTINGETAQPGERIEGVFRNGYVNMGTWYKNDGNAVVVKGIKVV